MTKKTVGKYEDDAAKRSYLSQSDVPARSLEQAMRVPRAIADNYGKSPTKPLRVAEAMGVQPGSSGFRMLCGAAIAYGLTDGGYNSDLIALTALGRRIVAPTAEGDDLAARREALLRPRVLREFLTRYNESKLPSEQIGRNVLEEMGVPVGRTAEVFDMIVEGARSAGFLRELKGQTYVDLEAAVVQQSRLESSAADDRGATKEDVHETRDEVVAPAATIRRNGRVFITHGKNKDIVSQLKDLLTFGGFTPIVAMEQETVSKPVPDKVLGEMRSCDAAIIHVGTETRAIDSEGREHRMLNQNVLIEIGAAMALYGHKFILLVEKGVTLPSNLQGLYEVRYEGDKLDYDSTMRLLRAFNDFRS
jgi:predicted nucleotide-binding protein